MVALVYPASLPCPQRAPYSRAERRALSDVPGQRRARTLWRDRLGTEPVQFLLTFEQVAIWRAWYESDQIQGGAWFAADWREPFGRNGVFRFMGAPSFPEFIPIVGWRVSALVEVRGRSMPPQSHLSPDIGYRWSPALGDNATAVITYDEDFALGDMTQAGEGQAGNIRTAPPIAGKRYAEIEVVSLNIVSGIGIGDLAVGVCEVTEDVNSSGSWWNNPKTFVAQGRAGNCGNDVGLYAAGAELPNAAYAFGVGDVIGLAFDAVSRKLWVRINGAWVTGNPVAGTGPSLTLPAGSYQFYAGFYSCFVTGDASYRIRVASSEFSDSPPSGFFSYSGA